MKNRLRLNRNIVVSLLIVVICIIVGLYSSESIYINGLLDTIIYFTKKIAGIVFISSVISKVLISRSLFNFNFNFNEKIENIIPNISILAIMFIDMLTVSSIEELTYSALLNILILINIVKLYNKLIIFIEKEKIYKWYKIGKIVITIVSIIFIIKSIADMFIGVTLKFTISTLINYIKGVIHTWIK